MNPLYLTLLGGVRREEILDYPGSSEKIIMVHSLISKYVEYQCQKQVGTN